jgi:hypothetical protein
LSNYLILYPNVQVLEMSLIGNAVKTGRARRCDPALVSLAFKRKRELFQHIAPLSDTPNRGMDGKAAERAGESEDLPEQRCHYLRGLEVGQDLADKKGTSPDRWISVRVFFAPGQRPLTETT